MSKSLIRPQGYPTYIGLLKKYKNKNHFEYLSGNFNKNGNNPVTFEQEIEDRLHEDIISKKLKSLETKLNIPKTELAKISKTELDKMLKKELDNISNTELDNFSRKEKLRYRTAVKYNYQNFNKMKNDDNDNDNHDQIYFAFNWIISKILTIIAICSFFTQIIYDEYEPHTGNTEDRNLGVHMIIHALNRANGLGKKINKHLSILLFIMNFMKIL
jgi:hypothetical protein